MSAQVQPLRRLALVAALAGVVAAACSAGEPSAASDRGPYPGDPGGGANNPGSTTGNGGAAGSSGASGPGGAPSTQPGVPVSGSGGSSLGTGGSTSGAGGAGGLGIPEPDAGAPNSPPPAADAAASFDAAPGGGPFSCAITLQALMPTRTDGLPAGEGNIFRMGATASGAAVPAKPVWHWKVTHESGAVIPFNGVDGEPAAIDFPTVKEGVYTVLVDLVGISNCVGTGAVRAVAPAKRSVEFFLRVTPPAGQGLAVLETDVVVQSDQPIIKGLEFESPPPVGHVDPHEGMDALPAFFVQISSPTSTARYEAYLDTRVSRPFFDAPLIRGNSYNVLIVPDNLVGSTPRAPIVFRNLSWDAFASTSFQVDPGMAIAGKVFSSTGPLDKSRVRLRDELLPSTVGTTDANGAYRLQTRGGRFEARVVPPPSSGLPEAQLPRSAGIVIPEVGGLNGNLDFTYAALPMTRLVLTVQKSDGQVPEKPVNVLLQTLQGQLGNVGKFTVAGQDSIAVDGVVRIVQDTAAGGSLTIAKLPRAHYRVVISPPDNLLGDSAITTIEDLDLTGAGPTITRIAPLSKRGRITGRLLPATTAAGLMVRVVDAAEDGVRRNTIIVPVAADGHFEFASDPQRLYRLFVEPPADRRVPRLTLDPVRATTPAVQFDATLPARLSLSGVAVVTGQVPLRGAIVQVFCRGSAPACVDRSAADVSNTLPIDEALTGADGRYELGLPGATP